MREYSVDRSGMKMNGKAKGTGGCRSSSVLSLGFPLGALAAWVLCGPRDAVRLARRF